jgi:magnesium chelatase family protein
MLIKIKGSSIIGIEATLITIEINVSMGQGYGIVGLPDIAIKESLDRTESAIKANGFHMPRTKVLINLSPADIRKTGTAFDLPIAIGLIAASDQLETTFQLDQLLIMGELGLDGLINPIKGALAMALKAKAEKLSALIIPIENLQEASIIDGIPIFGFSHLMEVVAFIKKGSLQPQVHHNYVSSSIIKPNPISLPTLDEVKGQLHGKRALEIASAGGHNLIMIGPPGAGKTMLAKSIVSILPPLSKNEAIETTQIYSISNKGNLLTELQNDRPFRQPHHTISDIALIGGGSYPQPGEISLAHNGVLFLDELPEFKRTVIEVLRQPMEEGIVHISRAKMNLNYPARFMLVAAMNPCPCGYYNHPSKDCICSTTTIHKYLHKISGPLLDRIDLHVELSPVPFSILNETTTNRTTEDIKQSVLNARIVQSKRFKNHPNTFTNAQMDPIQLKEYCKLKQEAKNLLQNAMEQFQLSARAHDRILRVARTIADLEAAISINQTHISEAIQYRCLDRESWGKWKK